MGSKLILLRDRHQGFTLMEVLVVTVVVGVLAAMAMPSFNQMLATSQVRGLAAELASEISLARSEAIKQHRRVVMNRTGSTWKEGWILYVDTNGNSTQDSGEQTLKTGLGFTANTVKVCTIGTSFDNMIVFRGDGTVQNAAFGSEPGLRVVDDRGTGTVVASRNVVLSPAGRASVEIVKNGTGATCP